MTSTSLPKHSKSAKLISMRKLTATLCLTIALILGSLGVSWSAAWEKGYAAYKSGDYATALREWTPLAEQGDADQRTHRICTSIGRSSHQVSPHPTILEE